jgi:hypothetical protein
MKIQYYFSFMMVSMKTGAVCERTSKVREYAMQDWVKATSGLQAFRPSLKERKRKFYGFET